MRDGWWRVIYMKVPQSRVQGRSAFAVVTLTLLTLHRQNIAKIAKKRVQVTAARQVRDAGCLYVAAYSVVSR